MCRHSIDASRLKSIRHGSLSVAGAYRSRAIAVEGVVNVRYGPIADISCLFDYLISGLLQMRRHGKAERLGGLEVNYEHELGWCLYREIVWIFAL